MMTEADIEAASLHSEMLADTMGQGATTLALHLAAFASCHPEAFMQFAMATCEGAGVGGQDIVDFFGDYALKRWQTCVAIANAPNALAEQAVLLEAARSFTELGAAHSNTAAEHEVIRRTRIDIAEAETRLRANSGGCDASPEA